MNTKGVFSIALLLFFIVLSIKTAQIEQEISKSEKQASQLLLEMEQASFLRSELETNFDFMAKQSMGLGSIASPDSELLKEFLNTEIARFAQEPENAHPKKAEFFFFSKQGNQKEKYSAQKMKELFNTRTTGSNGAVLHEFNFTGGLEKDTMFGAEIRTENFTQYFFITPEYSVKVLGVR